MFADNSAGPGGQIRRRPNHYVFQRAGEGFGEIRQGCNRTGGVRGVREGQQPRLRRSFTGSGAEHAGNREPLIGT